MRSMVAMALLSLVLNGAVAAGCGTREGNSARDAQQSGNKSAVATPTPEREIKSDAGDGLKVLGEGWQSRVDDAFVAVARDAETYAQLRELAGQLPEMSADFFMTNVVVAAFLGRRNTGGYAVRMMGAPNGVIRLAESKPTKDMMVTQSITTPFKVVSVPLTNRQPLWLEMEGEWKTMTRPFRVSTGDFHVTGGFIGSTDDFRLEGEIGIMRQGKLATLAFDLKATGETKTRALKDVATGVAQPDGGLKITRMTGGTLVSPPPTALRADGKFNDGENNLTLTFESLPSNIADGYQGRGKLEATATAPPPLNSN